MIKEREATPSQNYGGIIWVTLQRRIMIKKGMGGKG
jgi:hypothetical protein